MKYQGQIIIIIIIILIKSFASGDRLTLPHMAIPSPTNSAKYGAYSA